MNQFDIIMTAIASVRIGQTNMPYKGELQICPQQGMKDHVCSGESCYITITQSAVTMLDKLLFILVITRQQKCNNITRNLT